MADTVRKVDYFYAKVPDRAGAGNRILAALKREGVDLQAFIGFPAGRGRAQLDFVPKDVRAFRKAATKLGLKLSPRKRAFLVQGGDRPGAVAAIEEKLAKGRINVVAAQALCAGSGRWGMILWVKPKDYRRASTALGA